MADKTRNPEALDDVKAVVITNDVRSFVTSLASDIRGEHTNLAPWQTYIDRYRNLRYGIRNVKTTPWPNCANYVLQLADDHINRLKPYYINVGYGMEPICVFTPFGPEDVEAARKRELLFHWRMLTQVKFFDQYVYGIDKLLQDGAVVYRVMWRFETATYTEVVDLNDFDDATLDIIFDAERSDDDLFALLYDHLQPTLDLEENVRELRRAVDRLRKGDTVFELTLHEIKHDRPQVVARDLRDDVVLPVYTVLYEDNLDNARFIDDKDWTTVNDLLIGMRDGKYVSYPADTVRAWVGKSTDVRKAKPGASAKTDEDVLLHRVCCWYDVNGDDIKERCIATYPDAAPGSVLSFVELPYDHGQWPYTLVKRELNDPDIYSSRGIPAVDEDYQVGMSTAFNQAIDNGTIVNTPKVVYKRGAVSNVRNARYIPGEPVEIIQGSLSDYEVRQQLNTSQAPLFQQAQYLKGLADQRVGDTAGALSGPQNTPGLGQGGKRTKAEITLMSAVNSGPQAMDLLVFQMQMARVYAQIDALYEQFADAEEYALITNEGPVTMSRREIQGRFNIMPNGRLDNNSPELRAQKALNLLHVFAGDPDIRQYELKKLFLQNYDPHAAAKVLLTEAQMAQRDAAALQEQQASEAMLKQSMAEVQELKDALEVRKELALSVVHGRKYAPDEEEDTRPGRGRKDDDG